MLQSTGYYLSPQGNIAGRHSGTPFLCTGREGNIHVLWSSFAGDSHALHYASIVDGRLTPPRPLQEGESPYTSPVLAAVKGGVSALWVRDNVVFHLPLQDNAAGPLPVAACPPGIAGAKIHPPAPVRDNLPLLPMTCFSPQRGRYLIQYANLALFDG